MSAALAVHERGSVWLSLRRFGPTAALVIGTLALGAAGISVARPVFIAGCAAVAFDALRFGARTHFPVSIVLFCLAPFLRRAVDAFVGYDPSGIMISGPLIAILAPAPLLLTSWAERRRLEPAWRPFLLAAACGCYAVVLTMFNGSLVQAASGGLKWVTPCIYGMWLHGQARRETGVLEAGVRTLLWLIPLLGVYGAAQYLNPPLWDRYWMTYTTIASIGQPEPFMVRVFSTMNAPAGYATFTATALLLFGFRKARWSLLLAAAPSVLGLLLSLYRTAWIALVVGLAASLLHRRTRERAATLFIAGAALVLAAVSLTPAGETLGERLSTLGTLSNDASGQERLSQYGMLLQSDGGTLLGHGFDSTDVMQAGALALDGQLIVSWYTMGLVVGLVCVAAVCWAGLQAIGRAWRSDTVAGTALAAALVGVLAQLPLAVISSSETGFLFWSLAALGAAMPGRGGPRHVGDQSALQRPGGQRDQLPALLERPRTRPD